MYHSQYAAAIPGGSYLGTFAFSSESARRTRPIMGDDYHHDGHL